MTTLTFNLPDELIQKAKQADVFSEQEMNHVLEEFLRNKIEQRVLFASKSNTLARFLDMRDTSVVPEGFMQDRQQPPVQERALFDGIDGKN